MTPPRITVVIAILLGAAACDAGPTATDTTPASVSVSPATVDLAPAGTYDLTAVVLNAAGDTLAAAVTWSSDQPAVATVDGNGRVTAVTVGNAEITASAGPVHGTATVRVIQTLDLEPPLVGVMNQDFYLVNYVDHAAGSTILDYFCGPKSYDSHNGTDITLKSFAQMDTGIAIVAAAQGVVSFTHDGEYDRNTTWDNGGGLANHVVLDHGDGHRSYYGHMRRNSVAVQVGQNIAPGDTLGLVGSSGTSDHPHLHFEIRAGLEPVDPYAGDCGPTVSHWASQGPYQNTFRLIDAGVTVAAMDLDLAKQPPPTTDTVATTADRVYGWVHLHNVRSGSSSSFRFIAPDGSTFNTVDFTHETFYSMSWWWAWQSVQGFLTQTGTWQVEYANNGTVLATTSFELVEGSSTLRAGEARGASTGHGGGGLRTPERGSAY